VEHVGVTPRHLFYFFFAAFTGFFAFAFLTIFNIKYTLLLYKFMLVDLSYYPFTKDTKAFPNLQVHYFRLEVVQYELFLERHI